VQIKQKGWEKVAMSQQGLQWTVPSHIHLSLTFTSVVMQEFREPAVLHITRSYGMTTDSLQMNSSYWLSSCATPMWGAHALSLFQLQHTMPGLSHLGQGIICWIKIMTVRKAVMCQDRATAGILKPWLRLCKSTMMPSTQCILPESLRKRTQLVWHPTQPQNVSNAYHL
jgi:hypothetical protein